jgi:HSP90 family molecular chaperone
MVADEVQVTSRSYRPEAAACAWISRGDNTYQLAAADKATRGTTIDIKLKQDAAEFASSWQLEQVIKKHSDYVAFPITVGDKVVNRQTAPGDNRRASRRTVRRILQAPDVGPGQAARSRPPGDRCAGADVRRTVCAGQARTWHVLPAH